MISINGRDIPLESLSEKDKSKVWDAMAKSIGEAVTDYMNKCSTEPNPLPIITDEKKKNVNIS
jgi:hypothetical protein